MTDSKLPPLVDITEALARARNRDLLWPMLLHVEHMTPESETPVLHILACLILLLSALVVGLL